MNLNYKSKTSTKFTGKKLHAVSVHVSTSSSTLMDEGNSEVLEGNSVEVLTVPLTSQVSTHEVMFTD